jgi:hypothetical protein
VALAARPPGVATAEQVARASRSRLRGWEIGALVAVLGASAMVRLVRLDLAQVGYDESAAASLVQAWKVDGQFPLTGIVSSVGIPNPPAWPYVLALAIGPLDSAYALVVEGVACSLLAIGLTWWIARRWLGAWGGLAATCFYAFGFWAMLLGRSAWQPAFLQVPVLLCLDGLLMLGARRRPWALALACGWLGLMVQLHYVAVGYALMLPLAAWPARRALRWRHLGVAVLAGALPLAPFLMYEAHPAVAASDVRFLFGQASGGSRLDASAWNLLWNLAGNGGVAGLGGAETSGLQAALGRWVVLGRIGELLLAAGLVVGVLEGVAGRLVAAWVLLPAVFLARHSLDVLFHYLYLDLPAMALAVGMLGAWSVRQRLWARAGVAAALGLYAAVSLATLGVVLAFVDSHDVYLGYGMPLRYSLAAAQAARAAARPGGVVLVGGPRFQTQVLRFALGEGVASESFEACGLPSAAADDVLLLLDEASAAGEALRAQGVPLLARVARPGGTYAVFGGAAVAPVACATAAEPPRVSSTG